MPGSPVWKTPGTTVRWRPGGIGRSNAVDKTTGFPITLDEKIDSLDSSGVK